MALARSFEKDDIARRHRLSPGEIETARLTDEEAVQSGAELVRRLFYFVVIDLGDAIQP